MFHRGSVKIPVQNAAETPLSKLTSNRTGNIRVKSFYPCRLCKFTAINATDLQEHNNALHLDHEEEEEDNEMNVPGQKFSTANAFQPVYIAHSDQVFECTLCDYKTNRRYCLTAHLKASHLNPNSFKCHECDYITIDILHLKNHAKTAHFKPFKCSHCKFRSKTALEIDTHMADEHSLSVKSSLHCPQCDYETNLKFLLKSHVENVHTRPKMVQCPKCEYKTNEKLTLQKHFKDVHSKSDPLKCPYCQFVGDKVENLKKHIEIIHLHIKYHQCNICNYQAFREYALKTHMLTAHSDKPRIQCDYCDKICGGKEELKFHVDQFHVKTYQCSQCDYKANRPKTLEKHIQKVHLLVKFFSCEYCNFKTNRNYTLKKHLEKNHFTPEIIHIPQYKDEGGFSLQDDGENIPLNQDTIQYSINEESIHYSQEECVDSQDDYIDPQERFENVEESFIDYETTIISNPDQSNPFSQESYQEGQLIIKQLDEFQAGSKDDDSIQREPLLFLRGNFVTEETSNKKKDAKSIHLITKPKSEYVSRREGKSKIKKSASDRPKNHQCAFCDYRAIKPAYLRKHVNAIHLKLKPFECVQCPFKTTRRYCLNEHIDKMHCKTHQCVECEYMTTSKSNLKLHMQTAHVRSIVYQCPICIYKTDRKYAFNAHMKKIHLQ